MTLSTTCKPVGEKVGPGPRTRDPFQSLKVGPPSGTSPFFNEFFFSKYFIFFFLFIFFLLFYITNIISGLIWFHRPFQVSLCAGWGEGLIRENHWTSGIEIQERFHLLLSYSSLIILKLVIILYSQILAQILPSLGFK